MPSGASPILSARLVLGFDRRSMLLPILQVLIIDSVRGTRNSSPLKCQQTGLSYFAALFRLMVITGNKLERRFTADGSTCSCRDGSDGAHRRTERSSAGWLPLEWPSELGFEPL